MDRERGPGPDPRAASLDAPPMKLDDAAYDREPEPSRRGGMSARRLPEGREDVRDGVRPDADPAVLDRQLQLLAVVLQ